MKMCVYMLSFLLFTQNCEAVVDEMLGEKFSVPQTHLHNVIIDCSAMSYMDSVAVSMLTQVGVCIDFEQVTS